MSYEEPPMEVQDLPENKPSEEAASISKASQPPEEGHKDVPSKQVVDVSSASDGSQKEGQSVAAAESTNAGQSAVKVQRRRIKVRTTVPNEGVDLAIGDGALEGAEPTTFGRLFQQRVQEFPDVVALSWQEKDGEEEGSKMVWKTATYKEYYRSCFDASKSYLKLGLEANHGVGIIGFNSPEWFISNNAAILAGGLSAGIYTTSSPEACFYVLDDCKANIAVVENQTQLEKILQIRDRLPHLKAIVQYKGKLSQEHDKVYDWKQFMELGKHIEDSVIEDKIKAQKPEQCAVLIYTSGTTGNPKGVMLSHDNITWVVRAFFEALQRACGFQKGCGDRTITYLPLSHVAAQVAEVYMPINAASTIYFARPDALKGSIIETLAEVRPTLFAGVPRVWEKFQEKIEAAAAEITGIKRVLGKWAKGVAFQANTDILNKQPVSWKFKLANNLVLKKIHQRLGLDCVRFAIASAAPVQRSTVEFFMGLNIPLMDMYGSSENSGPQTISTLSNWRLGSVGQCISGTHLKIDNPDENGEGEICMYGRHVFMGYLNNEEKTKEAIDDEGWLHSGDIGRIDEDGFLYITGRIKELIITAGGENIAPVPIEDRIKKELPFLSDVVLIGDKRKFVSCLVTLKSEMDAETGEPQDELLPEAKTLIAKLGSSCTKVSEILESKDEKLYSEITAGLERANKHAISHPQRVQKFTILERGFSIPGGELGPTLKLKRHVIVKKYAEQIDAMYVTH